MPKVSSKTKDDVRVKFGPSPYSFLKTNILPIDIILGGGIPRGSVIEVASKSGLGKSTLMAHIAKNLCKNNHVVEWWDYEHCLTDGLKESIGIRKNLADMEGFHHSELITYGDAEEFVEYLSSNETYPDLIVIDSDTAMLPDRMADKSILEQEIGLKARMSSNFLQKYKGWARKHNVTFVFISQMRVKSHGSGRYLTFVEESASGNALKFYADIRLEMKKKEDLKRKEITIEGEKEIVYGVESIIWAVKNKHVRSHVELSLPIIFGKGVSNLQILKRILIGNGVVTSSGSYFKISIPGIYEGNVQGNTGLFKVFKEYKDEINNWIFTSGLFTLTKEIV